MSWLFGINNNKKPDFSDIAGITPPASGDSGGGDDKTKNNKQQGMEAYRFDSSALERAAAAAKELEKSSK